MKREVDYKINDNGSYTEIVKVTQTPEDGFVSKDEMMPSADRHTKRFFKGYAIEVGYTTNDPRVTRPFVYGACGLIIIIGIILSAFHVWMIGIPFIGMALIIFFSSMKSINAIEKELKEKKRQDVTGDKSAE